jgi:hypothetical protein
VKNWKWEDLKEKYKPIYNSRMTLFSKKAQSINHHPSGW